jgi:hypothetical protein
MMTKHEKILIQQAIDQINADDGDWHKGMCILKRLVDSSWHDPLTGLNGVDLATVNYRNVKGDMEFKYSSKKFPT